MPFYFLKMPFYSRISLLFSRNAVLFPEVALSFSKSDLLFPRSAFLFLKHVPLFSRIILEFSRIAFFLFPVRAFFFFSSWFSLLLVLLRTAKRDILLALALFPLKTLYWPAYRAFLINLKPLHRVWFLCILFKF